MFRRALVLTAICGFVMGLIGCSDKKQSEPPKVTVPAGVKPIDATGKGGGKSAVD